LKLFYSLVAAGALLAASASAQVWPKPTTSGNFSVRGPVLINSASTIAAAPVRDTSAALDVILQATAMVTTTITLGLDNGIVVSTVTVVPSPTQPVSLHFAGPINFQNIKVNPTGVGSTNANVLATIVQSK
jgi:hypothetical protein